MTRADLVVALARAATSGDQQGVRRALEAIVAEERQKQHNVVADELATVLERPTPSSNGTLRLDDTTHSLVHEVVPGRKLDDLVLPEHVEAAVRQLAEEQHRVDLLRAYNLEPRNRVLLIGPPGNGKTSLAEALAAELLAPMFVVRYEGIVASYLGETASRLQRLFDFVRSRRCVLFLDEFATIAKERGDEHETGEIKRVVSSLLLQIDHLPSHVVVVTATNHPELLDRAVWRRFQVKLELPPPTRAQREEWFERFERRADFDLGYSPRTLADRLSSLSFAEIEEFALDIQRQWVLGLPEADARRIVKDTLGQWAKRAKAL
jgi:SpoVK/Ycf46/Vps4 family AAA+-type ATPase